MCCSCWCLYQHGVCLAAGHFMKVMHGVYVTMITWLAWLVDILCNQTRQVCVSVCRSWRQGTAVLAVPLPQSLQSIWQWVLWLCRRHFEESNQEDLSNSSEHDTKSRQPTANSRSVNSAVALSDTLDRLWLTTWWQNTICPGAACLCSFCVHSLDNTVWTVLCWQSAVMAHDHSLVHELEGPQPIVSRKPIYFSRINCAIG